MTLIELKEQIDELIECGSDPQMEVVMTADYGDICHTMQALPIRLVEERTTEVARGASKMPLPPADLPGFIWVDFDDPDQVEDLRAELRGDESDDK